MQLRFPRAALAIAATAVVAMATAVAQRNAGNTRPERIDGKPNLNGIWKAAMNTANWNLEAHAASAVPAFWKLGAAFAVPAGQSVVDGDGRIPYKPEALAKRDENRAGWPKTDPEAACYMPGIPRANYMDHPFQIVQGDTDMDVMFIYAFANSNRAVHMTDVRTIDEVPVDLWMGWSNGKWEGDTFVVETIANDDRTWFDRAGNHHSNQMVVTERFTLLDPNRINYQATINDPEVFTRPWTISLVLYKDTAPNAELLEYKCVEFSEPMLYGEHLKVPLE